MSQTEFLVPREGDIADFYLTAVCEDCGSQRKEGTFSGSVRAEFEFGKWVIGDARDDVEGTLVNKCVTHHLTMGVRHNHFELIDGQQSVGRCGLGGQIRYLAGALKLKK